jgi:hypothetical protein
MSDSQRFHSLDNLRAVVMWLGIVLHVAVNHVTAESQLPWRDRETSMAADMTLVFIHAFRMPVFFILAGFFVAMLVSRRGVGGMLKHRLRRLGLPFLVFWPPVFAGMVVLAMLYVHLMVRGSLGIDPAIMPKNPARPDINTMHMWFVYYLLWFCLLTALLGHVSRYLPDGFKEGVSTFWKLLASKWWGFIVLAVPLAVVGASSKWGIVMASGSFIPHFNEFIHNGLFFVVGLYVYRHRNAVLGLYSKNCWRNAAAGLLFFMLYLVITGMFRNDAARIRSMGIGLALIYNCVSWLWSFALIGFFIRYLSSQNRFLRYVSESSYWVYLVHMLGTIGFGVVLYNMPFGALTKMGINILATTLACVATYHVLVRYTPLSTLLNGHRFSLKEKQKLGEPASAA